MGTFDQIQIHKTLVGGKPVGFTESTGTLHLAGDDLSLEEWQELEKRINLLFYRAGIIKDPRKHSESDISSGTSSFLTANLRQILSRDKGIIKDPPFWLRGLYSGVITKEELWDR